MKTVNSRETFLFQEIAFFVFSSVLCHAIISSFRLASRFVCRMFQFVHGDLARMKLSVERT